MIIILPPQLTTLSSTFLLLVQLHISKLSPNLKTQLFFSMQNYIIWKVDENGWCLWWCAINRGGRKVETTDNKDVPLLLSGILYSVGLLCVETCKSLLC